MERQLSATWRKSTYSSANGGACVEAATAPGAVLVRDTTERAGGVLTIPPAAWTRFTRELRD